MIKIVIAGCRNFYEYNLLKKAVNRIRTHLEITDDITILSGKALGADSLGERYANEYHLIVKDFPALWDRLDLEPCAIGINKFGKKYNKLAGMNRNKDMANEADMLIAFWDMKSKGTKNMIDLALKKEIKVFIVDINKRKIIEK